MIDGNEAVTRVAYKLSEVIALYPITPATPMGEWADAWAAAGGRNLWGTVPAVIEMQSEGGAAGAIHRARALSPDHPVLRGSAQNPDVFFQARETVNPFYAACPWIVQRAMDRFAELTGRQYRNFEYHGAPDAERVIALMGSGCEAAHETVDWQVARGEKVGVLKVRLYRPFDGEAFVQTLPQTARAIAVLDRSKEPGSAGEPLYLDCVGALHESEWMGARVVGGRYGLSSKEFTPAMIRAVFDNLVKTEPRNHFTVGIRDDVSGTSLAYDPAFSVEEDDVFRAVFYGLGSDGTVGANKDTIRIIGEETGQFAQGYFVYDSKKAGSVTVSHLRFGPRPIRSTYLISQAQFVGCHQPSFLERYDVLDRAAPGATFLLNTPFRADRVWERLPGRVQRAIHDKALRFFVIDASAVARACGMGGRINTVMQVCFFSVSGVLPHDEAIAAIQDSIRKTYGRKGTQIVQMNLDAVEQTLAHLHEVEIPGSAGVSPAGVGVPPARTFESVATRETRVVADRGSLGSSFRRDAETSTRDACAPRNMPQFVRKLIAGRGDQLPVSAMPCDGTFPTGTARWEKRNLAAEVPVWDADICIQCAKCAMVCPHAVIRAKWLLYRHDPRRIARGENPLQLDSAAPRMKVHEYLQLENRFRMLEHSHPDAADALFKQAQQDADTRWALYEYLAARPPKETKP